MSDLDLEKRLLSLEQKLDLLLNDSDRSYDIGEFCKAVGLSRYKLKQLWTMYKNELPISQPVRNGKDVEYTQADVVAVKAFLNERRING